MTAAPDTAGSSTGAVPQWDFLIVGAGLLGLATARELLRRDPSRRVAVVEREAAIASHQSGRNSGVIHAGIYYPAGSLKARLCREGAATLYEYCTEHGIAFERCGKLIVAKDPSELGRLDALEERGRANNVPGLRRLAAEEIAEIEPHCVGIAALHSPSTGIVDFPGVASRLAVDVQEAGGTLFLQREVLDVRSTSKTVELDTPGGALVASHAVFCAGAWSDRLAEKSGVKLEARIVPFRGQYLRLRPEATRLVRGLIYPVPDPALPFLGVHLTRHISGEVWLGPSALFVGARDAYRLTRVSPSDLGGVLAWPGTWRMARRFWRSGLDELKLAASRRGFVEACASFVPELVADDVVGGPSGIRAQAVARDGKLVDDFLFSEAGRSLHVLNAPSPAATSSLAIASVIADRVETAFANGN